MKTSLASLLLGCLYASAVPAFVMPLLLGLGLVPDPMMSPTSFGPLLMGMLMTATVALFVGLFFSFVIGFPVLAILARANSDNVWIPAVTGAVAGAAVGGSGYFGSNVLSWGLICGINGALCGAVAFLCSRPNPTVERDARKSSARPTP